jgi:hypothetical protein
LNKYSRAFTPTDKVQRALASIMMDWILKAWKEVPDSISRKSVLKCCLSNADASEQRIKT